MYSVIIVAPTPQSDHSPRLPVLQPELGLGQPFGCAILPNPFIQTIPVDRPRYMGLLKS